MTEQESMAHARRIVDTAGLSVGHGWLSLQEGIATALRVAAFRPSEAPAAYHDAGLPIETEVYGLLDALGISASHEQTGAIAAFIRGRLLEPGALDTTLDDAQAFMDRLAE